MITYIRAIRPTFTGIVPVSPIGCVVGIAGLGAVAVTVRVRSQVEAISFVIKNVKQITHVSPPHEIAIP
jgi:hypothetical protein